MDNSRRISAFRGYLRYALKQSFFPAFAILHICAALDPHTDGIVNAKKKGSASNALTSLAGKTDHPHYGWRCSGC
jgi:hypothetical protein